jgi:hypothetical protein
LTTAETVMLSPPLGTWIALAVTSMLAAGWLGQTVPLGLLALLALLAGAAAHAGVSSLAEPYSGVPALLLSPPQAVRNEVAATSSIHFTLFMECLLAIE